LSTPGQTAKILGEVAKRHGSDYRKLSSFISLQKRQYIRAAKAVENADGSGEDQNLALAYKEYETRMKAVGFMDFDSLLLESVDLLSGYPDIREKYQYRFIMVDECQDVDPLQISLVKLISEQHGNVLFVGDSCQNIYSWRGSSSDLLLNFEEHFPGGKTLHLVTNYRATKKLCNFNYQIAPSKPPIPYVSPNDEGVDPVVEKYPNETEEAKSIANKILGLYDQDGRLFEDTASKKTKDPSAAILARTNRSLRPHEEALGNAGVRYHLIGKSGFFSQPEIRAVLAYTQLAA
jgi:DNA helicase-2/ATP-dependent DNA helicase PcrA